MKMTSNVILCAALLAHLILREDVAAADDRAGVDNRNLRKRQHGGGIASPLNLFQQSTVVDEGVINRDVYGNMVEVAAAPQLLRGQDDTPPTSPSPPLNLFKETRIVNGVTVQGGNAGYPFQTQLGWGYCGGSLISPNMVLTAGHCVDGGPPTTVSIWNGSRMESRAVKSYLSHEHYDDNDMTNDIALIVLKQPALPVAEVDDGAGPHWKLVDNNYDWLKTPPIIRLQRYQSPSGCTSLSQDEAKDITTLLVIGYGSTKYGGSVSTKLLEADVHYVANERCELQYGKGSITDDMICAADIVQRQDSCQGDSGGPLFTRLSVDGFKLFTQVGVVSWGYGCASKTYPGVYSRVAANADWIDEQVCGVNGLSPLSCTADGKIRDYALDSLTGSSSRRLTQNNVVTNNERDLAVLYGEEWKKEVCELLGGSIDEPITTSTSPSTVPSTSISPTTSVSPSRAPVISPSMMPSVSPSHAPSVDPTGSPSRPPGKSPTKKYIASKNKQLNMNTKFMMFRMEATTTAEVVIEKIAIKTKDVKNIQVNIYYQAGSYDTFPSQGMSQLGWKSVYSGIPGSTLSGMREAVLDNPIKVPPGQFASFYIERLKGIMYAAGTNEFGESDVGEDFTIYTGASLKKPFLLKVGPADFAGELTYYTLAA